MSNFTMQLSDVVRMSHGHFGLDLYPIFDPLYRAVLNDKIKGTYYYREIGAETIDVFVHNLNATMCNIMPYYNKLYASEKLQFDPMSTLDYKDVINGTVNQNDTKNSTASSNDTKDTKATSRATNLSTPQMELAGNADYASGGTVSASESAGTGATNASSQDEVKGVTQQDTTHSMSGRTQSGSGLLQEYRATLLNIDMMVVDEINPLFLQVWNTGNSSRRENVYGAYSGAYPYWTV